MESSEAVLGTRAVVRFVETGCYILCAQCGERIVYSARNRPRQVICNIYEGDKWDRVEQYHFECYEQAGRPYGISGPLQPAFYRSKTKR